MKRLKRKSKSILETYLIVLILVCVTSLISIYIFMLEDEKSLTNLIVFVMTVMSVLIALLAYHISVKTYISIDAVNAMSRMDGNVMEYDSYRTGIYALIRSFERADRNEAADVLVSYIEKNFKKETDLSGAKLADSIQQVIDVSVLVSLVIIPEKNGKGGHDSNKVFIDRLRHAVSVMDEDVDKLDELSEGSCILMRESVKLIKAVFSYQLFAAGCGDEIKAFLLMDVRGMMLKNIISRTIYYNYVGLFYMRKACEVLNGNGGLIKGDIYSIENLRLLPGLKDDVISYRGPYNLAVVYLNEAVCNYDNALKSIDDEIMWNSFIQYNKARAEFLLERLMNSNSGRWKETMNKAIIYRGRLDMILTDIVCKNTTATGYYQRAFHDQLKLAQLTKARFEVACNEDITNELCGVIASRDNYSSFLSNRILDVGLDEFLRLGHVRDDIVSSIKGVDK